MYNNAGKSIKGLVKIVVGIQMALFIILGIVLMVSGEGGAGAFLGFLVGGAGCFFAWLSGLLLYAYGEIADGVKRLAERTQQDTEKDNRTDESNVGDTWTCAGCGTQNPATRKYCLNCSITKEWSDSRNS